MNVLKDIPYNDEMPGKRKLADEKHLLMMQVALMPGQSVPKHHANSNLHLLVLKGELVLNIDGKELSVTEGDLVPVVLNAMMGIDNQSGNKAAFLVLKTPNPN